MTIDNEIVESRAVANKPIAALRSGVARSLEDVTVVPDPICASCGCLFEEQGEKAFEGARIMPLPNEVPPEFVEKWRDKQYIGVPFCRRCVAVQLAREEGRPTPVDWYAYLPNHEYMFEATRELWPAASVNQRLAWVNTPEGKVKTSNALDKYRHVEQMVWAPGRPTLIADQVVSMGGWTPAKGCNVFNLYRPPAMRPGCAACADLWIEHVWRIYPDDADHIMKWLAYKVQNPGGKINHALVLGGDQGIGKDTLLEPVKRAVGQWNFQEVSPADMLKPFNGFVKSVILRVNEARDLGDFNRYSFYDHTKIYAAAPPDVLRCNEKYLREHYVDNVCGLILTTNHKTDGLFLPEDDRRHYVAWSTLTRESFSKGYWNDLWAWYNTDDGDSTGFDNVAAFLREFDLSDFDEKAPPKKTAAFWEIMEANRNPEEAELADVLDALSTVVPVEGTGAEARVERPAAVTLGMIAAKANADFAEFLADRRNRRAVPHRLESMGYVSVRKHGVQDGAWVLGGTRMTIYARKDLTRQQQYDAALKLVKDFERKALPKEMLLLICQTPAEVLRSRGIRA